MMNGCSAFVFLFLGLAAVRGQQERRSPLVPNLVQAAQSEIGWTCRDTCDSPFRVVTCRFEGGRKCLYKFHMVCLEKPGGKCDWETFTGSCRDEGSDTCETIMKSKKGRMTLERNMRSIGGNLGIQKMLSNINRRNMETYGEDVTDYEPRSVMVSSSGNAHAYASDGERIAESHYGNPPSYSKPVGTDFFGNPLLYIFAQAAPKTDEAPPPPPSPSPSPLWMTGEDTAYPGYDYNSYRTGYGQSYSPYRMPGSNLYGRNSYTKPYVDLYGNYGRYKYPGYQTGSPLSQFFTSFGLPDPWLWI